MDARVWLFGVVLLLPGCMEEPAAQDPGTTVDDWILPGVELGEVPTTLDQDAEWGKLVVNVRGDAGSWLVIYRALPTEILPGDELSYHVRFEAEASGAETVALYVMPPELVDGNSTSKRVRPNNATVHVSHDGSRVSHELSEDRTFVYLAGEAPVVGVLSIVGSTGTWEAVIEVTLAAQGNSTGPSFAQSGTGTSAAPAGQHLVGLAGPSDQFATSLEIEAEGLTHIEFSGDSLSDEANLTIRECELTFGEQSIDCSRPLTVSQDKFGKYPNGGTAAVDMTYLRTGQAYAASIVHLPIGWNALPPGLAPFEYRLAS